MEIAVVMIFLIGYTAIALEHKININKAASALLTGVLCWTLFALYGPGDMLTQTDLYFTLKIRGLENGDNDIFKSFLLKELRHHLSDISAILFFLMSAMTIVELIDAHGGFRIITDKIVTQDKRSLLWVIGLVTFFLSAVLDNLTTAIVMVSLLRKLIKEKELKLYFAGVIIIAANAGGAWSPIGDVTTTMLWIGGQISSGRVITALFIPSMVCLLVPLIYLSFKLKGRVDGPQDFGDQEKPSPQGKKIFFFGIGSLMFVPVFKTITHLPPFMGILFGLGALWLVSEIINPETDEFERKRFTAAYALSRIDVSSALFFLGILLAVAALQSMHILNHFANQLNTLIGDNRIIISLIGVISAIVDNVPLVAATMGMYSLQTYPPDATLWHYLAYCAGTGGSLLIIGSAAGVAVMGMERVDFIWYVKNISLLALMGYVAGALCYLGLNTV